MKNDKSIFGKYFLLSISNKVVSIQPCPVSSEASGGGGEVDTYRGKEEKPEEGEEVEEEEKEEEEREEEEKEEEEERNEEKGGRNKVLPFIEEVPDTLLHSTTSRDIDQELKWTKL